MFVDRNAESIVMQKGEWDESERGSWEESAQHSFVNESRSPKYRKFCITVFACWRVVGFCFEMGGGGGFKWRIDGSKPGDE